MKKLIAFVLAFTLLLSLCACDRVEAISSRSASETATPMPAVTATAEPAAEATNTPEPELQEPKPTAAPVQAGYIMEDYVVVKNEKCALTITSIDPDGYYDYGFVLTFLCENFTDKSLIFTTDDECINGYMVSSLFIQTVPAGESASSEMWFSKNDLELCGITMVEELTFLLEIHDSEDYSAEYLVEEDFTVYLTGLSADTVTYAERAPQESDVVVLDDENITFIITGNGTDKYWGYQVNCYIVNKTDKTLWLSLDKASVNGAALRPSFYVEIRPGKRAYANASFKTSDLEANNIQTVEVVEFTLQMVNTSNYRKVGGDKAITYKP